jgi:hypothetical protein
MPQPMALIIHQVIGKLVIGSLQPIISRQAQLYEALNLIPLRIHCWPLVEESPGGANLCSLQERSWANC